MKLVGIFEDLFGSISENASTSGKFLIQLGIEIGVHRMIFGTQGMTGTHWSSTNVAVSRRELVVT